MKRDDLTVAMIQMDPVWEDPEANRRRAEDLMGTVGKETDLVILPEMFTTGFSMDPARLAEEMSGETVRWMKSRASSLNAALAGSLVIREGGQFYNRFIVVTPGNDIFTYDKGHLFPLAGEDRVFTRGEKTLVFSINNWNIAPFICYDLRFPSWTRNLDSRFDCMIFSANWPAVRSAHWETLLRARAIENQAYSIGVNRTGTDGNGTGYQGGSMAFDYNGGLMTDLSVHEGAAVVTLSREKLMLYREEFPYWKDADGTQS